MALTRKMLKAMGIEDEKIDQIIEAHAETTEALKAERDAAQQAAKENENAQKELEDLKANKTDEFQSKYEAEHEAFEAFKKEVEETKAKEVAKNLFTSTLAEMGITGKRATQIAKVTDLSAYEVKNGAYTNPEKVQEAIKNDWSEFVPTETVRGAQVATPPTTGAQKDYSKMTMQEYVNARMGKTN